MGQAALYRSVLEKLSAIPAEYLQQVDAYLTMLQAKATVEKDKKKRAKAIMGFAGAWADMSDEAFEAYLVETKKVGNELFSREIEL